MDIDSRGIKRGACKDCDCSCYEKSVNTQSCGYCGCFPTKHAKIEVVEESFPLPAGPDKTINFVTELANAEISFQGEKKGSITAVLEDVEQLKIIESELLSQNQNILDMEKTITLDETVNMNYVTVTPDSPESEENDGLDILSNISSRRNEIINSCVPTFWSNKGIQKCIKENSTLDINKKNEIIRTIVERMTTSDFTDNQDFLDVANFALAKIPLLKPQYSEGNKSLVSQMKKCFYNKKYACKMKNSKKSATNSADVSNEELVKLIQEEMENENPSQTKLKSYLDSCRDFRKADIQKNSSAVDHLKKFSALKIPSMLLWEFERTFNLEIKLLEERWNTALEKLRDYFIKDNVDGNLGREQLSIELLEIISTYFRPKNTKKTSNTQSLLQIFESTTTIRETIPESHEPPRLIGIGDRSKKNLKFTIYLDGKAMYAGEVVDSLIYLFALYWMFNIEFPGNGKAAFTFVAAVLFQHSFSTYYCKYLNILKVLESVKLF